MGSGRFPLGSVGSAESVVGLTGGHRRETFGRGWGGVGRHSPNRVEVLEAEDFERAFLVESACGDWTSGESADAGLEGFEGLEESQIADCRLQRE